MDSSIAMYHLQLNETSVILFIHSLMVKEF